MKKMLAFAICLTLVVSSAHAVSWSKKERWAMRIIGAGLVGAGFIARNQESDYNQKADDTINNFNSTHSAKGSPSFLNDQFNAVAQQSAYQRSASAWNIGKNASWGTAGLLFTISVIPNSWTRPVENGNGVMVGYDLKVGGGSKKK